MKEEDENWRDSDELTAVIMMKVLAPNKKSVQLRFPSAFFLGRSKSSGFKGRKRFETNRLNDIFSSPTPASPTSTGTRVSGMKMKA